MSLRLSRRRSHREVSVGVRAQKVVGEVEVARVGWFFGGRVLAAGLSPFSALLPHTVRRKVQNLGTSTERTPDIIAEWQEKWPNLPALWSLAWF